MCVRKYQSAIDATALLIQKVQKVWKSQKIAGAILMDVKRVFDYIFCAQQAQKMSDQDIDNDLIRWI